MLCSESELNLSNESEGIIELKNNEKELCDKIDSYQRELEIKWK